ncbi:uncharacterized protein DNG_03722 [Cephalotrichum gorgonifer]|uniref:SnoaL-like domain-containing protein n=1 Tax=Cephalotrichum gorgonifer TaxID=2041049 RepID=A0AAE8STW7_9PEZI|nr:uncharacterized protein DNG_03722 [Cephalotrichum gorgonifer]
MEHPFIFVLAVLALFQFASASRNCELLPELPLSISQCRDTLLAEQREKTALFALAYGEKDVDTMMSYVADPYIQHNPNIESGKDIARRYIKQRLSAAGINNNVTRVISDLNYALLHVHRTQPGRQGRVLADMYRLNGTCIVEHWDVQEDMNPEAKNPRAYF